ncbi:ribosomal protein S18 [Xylariaceae sp. FL0255]|nr:ribosomal protein S18 [Xylariaceae sp. FL0255]
MPPRISITSAVRKGAAALRAPISSTAAARQLRRDIPSTSTSSSILSIDESPSSSSTTSSTSTRPDVTNLYNSIRQGNLARQQRAAADTNDNVEESLRNRNAQVEYLRQLPRRWNPGEVYAPHDISASEMNKWRTNRKRQTDVVELLGLRPLDMYRNFSVISEFMTPHGRIKRAADTGLSPANQRKMAKAIRRAIGLGLHPSVHRHPELMMRASDRVQAQSQSENMRR